MRTKLFFDCEFTGLHKDTTLISLGIVSECNKTFYAEFNDFDKNQLNDWLVENVINNLHFKGMKSFLQYDVGNGDMTANSNTGFIVKDLKNWLSQFEEVEMWSDCLAYDWVLFCDLFGGALNLPKNIYYIPFDLATAFKMKGIDPDIDRYEFSCQDKDKKHNSLSDAKTIAICYKLLK